MTIMFLSIVPITHTSMNSGRSTGRALFVGDWAVAQLRFFLVALIAGAIEGAIMDRLIGNKDGWRPG